MFYDLHVPSTSEVTPELTRTVLFLSELGYTTLALSHTFSGKLPSVLTNPLPSAIPDAPSNLRLLRRITLVFDDPSQNHRLSALSSIYDLVAIRPTTEKVLLQSCTSLECDLISLDFSQRLGYHLKHKTVGTALARGLMFEICYSAGIHDTNARRNLIANAGALIRATRGGRGIIISSEAKKAVGLRAPHDVINLASLWGLSPEKSRDAITGLVRSVVVQARMRRTSFKGVVDLVDDGVTEEEKSDRKRKAEEQMLKVGSGKKAKGQQGQDQAGGGQKLTKAQRRAAAKAAKEAKAGGEP